jgi:hypothetical protein
MNYQSFLRHLKLTSLPAWSKRRYFIFCSPYNAVELQNVRYLDFEFTEESGGLYFNELDWQEYDPKFIEREDVVKTPDVYYDRLLAVVKKTSTVLSKLMTNVYTFRKAIQKPFTYDFCNWLYLGQSPEELQVIFKKYIREETVTKPKLERIFDAMTGEVGQKAQRACAVIRKTKRNQVNYDALSDEIGIEAYDLRYIVHIIDQGQPQFDDGGITVKQFDRNKNRRRRSGRTKRRTKDS